MLNHWIWRAREGKIPPNGIFLSGNILVFLKIGCIKKGLVKRFWNAKNPWSVHAILNIKKYERFSLHAIPRLGKAQWSKKVFREYFFFHDQLLAFSKAMEFNDQKY